MPMPRFTCDACGDQTTNPEDDYCEHVCDTCLDNRNERAWERHCTSAFGGSDGDLRQQQINALKFK